MGGRRADLCECEAAVDAVYLLLNARNRGTESVSAVLKRHGVSNCLRQAMTEAGLIEGTHSATRWVPGAARPGRDEVSMLWARTLVLAADAVSRSRDAPSGRARKPTQLPVFPARASRLRAVPDPRPPSLEDALRDAYKALGEAAETIHSIREQIAGALPAAKEAGQ